MNWFVKLWDWLNILIPPVLFSDLLRSFPSDMSGLIWLAESLSECASHRLMSRRPRLRFFPFDIRWTEEGNCVCEYLSLWDFCVNFVFVWDVSVQDEGRGIHRCLESALSCSHGRSELTLVEYADALDSFSRHWILRCILSKELRISHCWVIKCHMIVHWAIEIFTICWVSHAIILAAFDIKVRDPAEFTVDVSILRHYRIIWHPSTLKFVQLIRIKLSLGLHHNILFCFEAFIEILFVMRMVLFVVQTGHLVMSLVPLVIVRSQHAIISVFLYNDFGGGLSVGWISTTQLCVSSENVCQSFSTKWWLAIYRCNWWSELWINYNVFRVWH